MRLTTQDTTIQRYNVTDPARYASIEMNATAFEVLSSSIYTNKPLAVVRELCANALDAHNDAEQDQPFEIHLPTSLSPELIVRDFGTGLSHDAIVHLYMTYFGSNKRLTDKLVGGFGLGSKSPLAYTDSFVVTSSHYGHRRTYSVYKDESGMPAVQQLSDEHTDAHNGLEVRVAVSPSDFRAFVESARGLLPYFPEGSVVCPTHPNLVEPVTYFSRETLWGHRSSGPSSGLRAVVGPISYDIPMDAFSYDELDGIGSSWTLRHKNYDFFFDIGEVSLAVSRESLQFDQKTKEVILERLRLMLSEEDKGFAKAITDAPNFFHALVAASQAMYNDLHGSSLAMAAVADRFGDPSGFPGGTFRRFSRNSRAKKNPYSLLTDNKFLSPYHHGLAQLYETAHAQGETTAPTIIFEDVPLVRSPSKLIDLNPELEPVTRTSMGLLIVTPEPKYTFGEFRRDYHPNAIRLSELEQTIPTPIRSTVSRAARSGHDRSGPRAQKNCFAARHYSYPFLTGTSTITTSRAESDLKPDQSYCFVTLERLQELQSSNEYSHIINALLQHTNFARDVLRGARLVCISTRPPKYIQDFIEGTPTLEERLDAIQTDVLNDPAYLRARQAIERFRQGDKDNHLPVLSPHNLGNFNKFGHLKAVARLTRLAEQHGLARTRVMRLETRYQHHILIDPREHVPSRSATLFDRFANFYEQHPTILLIASGSFSDFYWWEDAHSVVRFAAINHLLSLETNDE